MMDTTGRIADIRKDWQTDKLVISFIINSIPGDIESLQNTDLDITAKRHREKRSLNANSYFHVLCQKIAEKTHTTLTHEKNRLIREYGCFEYIDGKIPTITMKTEYEDEMLDMEGIHVRVIARDPESVRFGLMRGSHLYNTAEMARLIDGAVSDAKDLGIDVMTPDELERMKALWTGKNS